MTLRRIFPWIILASGFALALYVLFAQPALAQGPIGSQCTGINCQACNLFELIDRLIKYTILIAVPIAALLFAYAGFLFITSGGDASAVSKARSIFGNMLMGFIIAVLGFVIVDTLLRSLAAGSFSGPSWSAIQCVGTRLTEGNGLQFSGGSLEPYVSPDLTPDPTNPGGGGLVVVPDQGTQTGIAEAMTSYQGASTYGGPGNGTVACAWAINNVLASAGFAPIDNNWVPSMEAQLQSGRGALIDQSAAQAGDIVIQNNQGHVGMCVNAGCTQVLSNSSSQAKFNWVSNTSFGGSQPGRIYRVVK